MDKKFDSIKYRNDYNREHYARLSVNVPLEDKPKIDEFWKAKGFKSFNAYVTDLIRRDMNENNNDISNVNIGNINNNSGGIIINNNK